MLKKCPPKKYADALRLYFGDLHPLLLNKKFKLHDIDNIDDLIVKYIQAANFEKTLPPIVTVLDRQIYYLFSSIEFDLPHTISNILILTSADMSQIKHEVMHIYLRYNDSKVLNEFIKEKKLHKFEMENVIKHIPQIIDNPDIDDLYAYRAAPNIFIMKVLTLNNRQIVPKYFTRDWGIWRPATRREIRIFNHHLPYTQNDHPKEIMAEIISSKYLG